MSTIQKKKIAVLGGGMASLTAVFELTSQPGWKEQYEITVYQMGWRLGGKGASGRNQNAHHRIEEHGLHILMGFYDNAFRVVRQCYQELGRSDSEPLASWQDALKPHCFIAFQEKIHDQYVTWPFEFTVNSSLPGDSNESLTVWEHIYTLIEYILEKISGTLNIDWLVEEDQESEYLPEWLKCLLKETGIELEDSSLPGKLYYLHLAYKLTKTCSTLKKDCTSSLCDGILWFLNEFKQWMFQSTEPLLENHHKFRRNWILSDLACTTITGLIKDHVITKGFNVIDDYDLREWLLKHGASEMTANSVLVRAVYNLVFGYQGGNIALPNLAAGTALRVMLRLSFNYKGAIFWKMQGGMGDIIFTPLYEVLKQRGVKFEFFHRVKHLGLSEDQQRISTIEIGRQVNVRQEEYQPLIDVNGLPCWPSAPLYEQLVDGELLLAKDINLESAWAKWHDIEEITLKAEEDFDTVILGISLGALKYICSELIDAQESWQQMLEQVKTTPTGALQLWLKPNLEELGWSMPSPVMDGHSNPLNTWADMSHLIPYETWPEANAPGHIAYFCGPLEEVELMSVFENHEFPDQHSLKFKSDALKWSEQALSTIWPQIVNSQNSAEVDWNQLVTFEQAHGVERFNSQYWRASIEPSDRYVLSVKGSTQYRLKSDESGFDNLYLAGDWTLNGLNIGCLEAAVISGMQAARGISGFPQKIVGEFDV